ncbi:hypothetical protein ECC37_07825 [Helicobacter pylori]|uniref:hypothetical protein n=1 Tax=Helicobacter pylori TaxID=210 RepID=UPI000FDF07F4|nr:hypothetical protein [Helicobacter pylori]RVY62474.1 hypothetical protein ECC37_07825 [Helicobacter pylori]
MFVQRVLKIIPVVLFLFCILSVFELVFIIEDMNKTEKLEMELKENLVTIKTIAELLNEHLEGMEQKETRKIKP